jgi:hypothetical protein
MYAFLLLNFIFNTSCYVKIRLEIDIIQPHILEIKRVNAYNK